MKKSLVILILWLLASCHTIREKDGAEKHHLLYSSEKSFLREDSGQIDKEYGSVHDFTKHHFRVEFIKDTIYAEAIQYVNACGNAQARLNIEGDAIVLTTKERSEDLCASGNWYLYRYWIKNPENKTFRVVQKSDE